MISQLNQGQVEREDFRQEGGAVLLSEGSFGRILSMWEQHWVKGRQEAELDRLIQDTARWLRESGGEPAEVGEEEDAG